MILKKNNYSLRLKLGILFPNFLCLKLFVPLIISIQHLLFFSTNIPLFIAFQSSITTSLTIMGVLVNHTDFTIKINTININHFLNNRVKLKWDTYFETEGVSLSVIT